MFFNHHVVDALCLQLSIIRRAGVSFLLCCGPGYASARVPRQRLNYSFVSALIWLRWNINKSWRD